MGSPSPPPAEELLKKIQELEAGHAHLQEEMTRLMVSGRPKPRPERRSHSVSPQRHRIPPPRPGGGPDSGYKKGLSFGHSSPLQRESRSHEDPKKGPGRAPSPVHRGPAAVNFTDRQYLNILQSMGQAVHIYDLDRRLIYWHGTKPED